MALAQQGTLGLVCDPLGGLVELPCVFRNATGAAIALTGYFTGTANFGSGMLKSVGDADIYIARYSAVGAPLWSHSAGGSMYDIGNRVALDATGNVVVVGSFQGSADFGTGKVIKSAGLAILWINGILFVRMIWTISVWVSKDSTNQPVWNSRS